MNENEQNELIYKVIGAAMRVHSEIGYGLREKTYERALIVELGQMLSYLRITKKTIGLIINFKHPSLQWRKVTLNP